MCRSLKVAVTDLKCDWKSVRTCWFDWADEEEPAGWGRNQGYQRFWTRK